MKRILQIKTCGMKCIAKEITIDFANLTLEGGASKVNNVKGIFGFNGAGKTAIITAVDYYLKIVRDSKFLLQNETIRMLDKLLNFKTHRFEFSIVFEYVGNTVIKHSLSLERSETNNAYFLSSEEVALSVGRSINGPYKTLLSKNGQGELFVNDEKNLYGDVSYLNEGGLAYASFITKNLEYLLRRTNGEGKSYKPNGLEMTLMGLYLNIMDMDVYLSDSDIHKNFVIDKASLERVMADATRRIQRSEEDFDGIYADETTIPKDNLEAYRKENNRLERFVRFFKPEVQQIELKHAEDGNFYHLRRIFHYEGYVVDLEFESSGIKQLVKLFSYLSRCARGQMVFIDEIDTNLNSVYFEKLILFFKNYGKGQLIFTTHSIEAMNALKGQGKSILALGEDNKIDVWVGKGNRSPIKDYIGGFFPHSPMNIEDFDFVGVFFAEE